MRVIVCGVLLVLTLGSSAYGQQRPLVTEDPETVGAGLILFEGGFDYQRAVKYPVAGLEGNLLRLPVLGLSFGISSIAEIQIDGGFYNRLTVTERFPGPLSSELDFTGDRTTDVEDLVVATKVRLVSEQPGRPAVALRFATRLPNASTESGIGLDTTDFFVTGLLGKTVESVRVVGNLGLGLLTDPTRGFRQNDVILYGVSLARAVQEGVEVVGELNGRWQTREADVPPGTESRSALRVGARVTRGAVRVDGGLIFGLTTNDPSVGFTAGLTWVFRGFQVP